MPSRTKSVERNRAARARNPQKKGAHVPATTANAKHLTPATWAICAVLAVYTLILYGRVGSHPFVNFDDNLYVTENVHVQAGLTRQTLEWAFTATEADNWHPLTWISHSLDCELFGLDAAGHHWVNVLIHALNVVLLFLLLQQATNATWRSVLVAALFAVHPLNVESVAWVAERKNVLSTFFFLLTLGAYGYYARRPGVKRYALVAGLFALGLAAKPMLVTLPFVLLLIDYWPLCRISSWTRPSPAFPVVQASFARLALEKLPLLALSAASAVLTMIAQRTALAPSEQFPFLLRIENAACSYLKYLEKTFWPARLAVFYPHPANTLPAWQWIGACALLLAITVLVWNERGKLPNLLVGWLWFLGTLVPVIGIVQVGGQAIADRYAYISLIGIFVAVIWSVRLRLGWAIQSVGAAIILVALSVVTWRQIDYWKSDYELWSHTLAITQNNVIAEDKLGVALQAIDRQQEAILHFTNAARLSPLDPLSNFSLGADLQWHGQLQEAVPYYETTIRESSNTRLRADAYRNLGTDYMQLGNRKQARENYLNALKANPGMVTVFAGLGELAGEQTRTIARSVVENPTSQGYLQLGRSFQQDGHIPEARLAYTEALILDPRMTEARQALTALASASP